MRVMFAGTPQTAVPSLDAIVAAGHEVAAVLTRPPAPSGRGRKLVASPVAERANALGIEVIAPTHPRDEGFRERLESLGVDVCPVVAYGALLPDDLLRVPRYGWINLHFSVLPRWRGAAPVQRGIIAGDPEVGATTFQIVRDLDAGPIYRTYAEPLDAVVTAGEALAALAVSGARLLVDTLADVEAGIQPTPQPADGVTLAAKLTVEGAEIDWRRDAPSLHDHVRGHSPEPGAWTRWRGERLKVLRTAIVSRPGLAVGALDVGKRQVFVGTGAGALELLMVQPAGKKPMAGADWARGGVPDGAVLG